MLEQLFKLWSAQRHGYHLRHLSNIAKEEEIWSLSRLKESLKEASVIAITVAVNKIRFVQMFKLTLMIYKNCRSLNLKSLEKYRKSHQQLNRSTWLSMMTLFNWWWCSMQLPRLKMSLSNRLWTVTKLFVQSKRTWMNFTNTNCG